jgi:AcrR family transcriptional regulator
MGTVACMPCLPSAEPVTDPSTSVDTRRAIVESASRCIRRRGLEKLTIVDVAQEAGVARGTVYSYFKDKAAIVEAVAENGSQQFYREMLRAMEGETTLEGQMAAAAVFVVRATANLDLGERSVLLSENARPLLTECVEFLSPYIAAARVTGEVRRELDVQAAAEWFARILFSFVSTRHSTLDLDDSEVVHRFVTDHVVRGFAAVPARPRRAS